VITVSIVIPVFNRVEFTRQCLSSLYRWSFWEGVEFEVIVVDNGSKDATGEYLEEAQHRYPNLRVLRNQENQGFARACNRGVQGSSGKYILFLNNDTEVWPGWLAPLVRVLERDERVAAVGSKLLFPDGTIQHAGVVVINHKQIKDPLWCCHIYRQKPSSLPEANERRVYQAVTAACMLVRRSAFEAVGGFDEGYWNGYEDVDLCFKFGERRWLVVYEPESVLIHYESQSGLERFKRVKNNVERLHTKWLGKVSPDLVVEEDGRILASSNYIRRYVFLEKPFTSLIILTRNNLEYTRLCLESIRKYTPEPHEIIVGDNGSTDGTVEYLENQSDVKLIKNGYNLGFALGNNRGLREARGDYIVFLNNDVVVTEGWLTRLLACAKEDGRVGAVGPRSNYVAGPQLVPGVPYGEDLKAMQEFARKWSLEHAGQWETVPRVIGFCMLVKRGVIERIGGFDPIFGTGNFEDDDFCLRLQLAGFTIKIAHDVFVHHFGSKTFQSESIDYRKLMERNWEIFKRKWNLPQHASMERGYVPAMLLRQSFQPEKHVVPLHFAPLPLDGLREKKYLATFSPQVVRFFVERFQADDPVTLVLYYPEEEAYEKVKRCLEEAGYPEEATPDILIHSTPLPERKIPELVAAVDVVLLDGADSPFLPWAVYLGKDIVSVE